MPWITENDKEYWLPDVLPEPTDEYQQAQSEKRYLTQEGQERMHPGWTYAENVAYVDDEYLFLNEGWKVIIDEKPTEPVINRLHYSVNSPEQWEEIDEKTIKKTYSFSGWIPEIFPESILGYNQNQRQKQYLTQDNIQVMHPGLRYAETDAYVDDEYLFQNEGWRVIIDEKPSVELKHSVRNSPELWEEIDEKTIKATYNLVDFSAEEIAEYEEMKWEQLRNKRDRLLQETDWIIIRANEENLVVSPEVTSYRQELRNLPQNVTNILEFDIENDALWPTKPEVYFEV